MTTYEQYVAVATFIKDNWNDTPFFTLGEVIENQTEFIVFEAFGIGVKDECLSGKMIENKTGYSVMCYSTKRPKSLKIASDLQVKFLNKKIGNLRLRGGEIKNTIKLEDNLFETEIVFKTDSETILGG